MQIDLEISTNGSFALIGFSPGVVGDGEVNFVISRCHSNFIIWSADLIM